LDKDGGECWIRRRVEGAGPGGGRREFDKEDKEAGGGVGLERERKEEEIG
jgi:hypothetical protein